MVFWAMSDKPRVLYLHPIVAISGGEIALLELLEFQNKHDFEPVVVLPSHGPLEDRIARLGISVFQIPLSPLKASKPAPFLLTVLRLWRFIKARHIALVHANCDLANQYGVIAARLAGVPIICHERLIPTRRGIRRSFLPLAHRIIAISHAVARPLLEYGIPEERVEVIHDSVDTAKFAPRRECRWRAREVLGLSPSTFVVGVVGRLCPTKGHHILLKAWSQVNKVKTQAMLLIVGYNEEKEYGWANVSYLSELHALIQAGGMAERVMFTGFQEDMISMYAAMDVVVVPSVWEEPFGKVQIEAMAMERPVIASRGGASPEIIEDGVSGLLFPIGNVDGLARSISILMAEERLRLRLAQNGRRRVQERFSSEQNLPKLMALHRQALGI